jgi:hypothetical protein
MRLTYGDQETQIVYWRPKDPKLQAAFPSLQRYSYRVDGESAWLESAEILRNIKITR